MIRIHRRYPMVRVGERKVRLSRAEHEFLTALGMMDNKVATHGLLLQVVHDIHCTQDPHPNDYNLIRYLVARLRRKIGKERIRTRPRIGYMLVGDVRFEG